MKTKDAGLRQRLPDLLLPPVKPQVARSPSTTLATKDDRYGKDSGIPIFQTLDRSLAFGISGCVAGVSVYGQTIPG
ncbi:MAG: hypothetical protein IPK21_21570 [Haliscomenobacter sp.]|nr:hypothetical protein [Haliscomenobacter sp.]